MTEPYSHEVRQLVGLDNICADAGAHESMTCAVCGTTCDVTRNLYGYTNMGEAMSRRKRLYDLFRCPRASEPWHAEATALGEEMKRLRSPRLRALVRADLDDLLALHLPRTD